MPNQGWGQQVNFSMEELVLVLEKETENVYILILKMICDIKSSTTFEQQLRSLY